MSGTTDDGGDADLPATDPEFLRLRAQTYDLLSACLDGDVGALVEAAENGYFVQLSAAFPVDVDPECLAEYDEEALEVGYENLFAVPGPHYVPPFASTHAADAPSSDDTTANYESDSAYHAGDAGELLGKPAAELAELYAAVGFEPTRGDGIPDHVAAAFEFLGALAQAEADRRTAGNIEEAEALADLQRRTLDRLGWLDEFHDRVREADSAEGAFARVVGIGRTFAAWDARSGIVAGQTDKRDGDSQEAEPTDDQRETTSNSNS
ncbi:molecular chaperone TorD family protein [Haloarcula nitratireducens]|uniref:Molecular chaperone TorD family protein n=1 Tax=Haloarcula nitratireducens TaxID=2487749 RepID=A0AAW4PFG9_9EURY|nr:molecular chaperone TorD family protein [Halomicroarcula nitratireducens]MBX0296694.1 molecular chaperone TorD family protein [Halomicroarcula nitratireducens]